MNAAIERRVTLTKRPVSDDVVAGLTGMEPPTAPAPSPEVARPPVQVVPASTPKVRRQVVPPPVPAQRRGPGRPRGRRRMEPFSSKIEIGLRDELDAYLAEHGESIVDFLDRVIRAGIAEPPPDEN